MNEENYMCYMPVSVLLDKSLPSGAKVMFLLINSLTRREGYCYASNRYFMERLDTSEATLKRWLSVLKEKGLVRIEIINDEKGQVQERRIYPQNDPRGSKMSPGGLKNEPQILSSKNNVCSLDNNLSNRDSLSLSLNTSVSSSNTKDKQLTDISKKETNKERKSSDDDVTAMFDRFWKEYPKKRNKQGSFRAFRNIKSLKAEFPNIIQGLERDKRSAQWNKDGGQFIPNPTTWLHQERWKDSMSDDRKGTWVGNLFVADF